MKSVIKQLLIFAVRIALLPAALFAIIVDDVIAIVKFLVSNQIKRRK
jgi:hypothetical protein